MRVVQNIPNLLILRSGPYAQMILATSIILSGFFVGLIASRLIPSLSVDADYSMLLTIIAILTVAGGIFLALFSQMTALTFDRTQGVMILEKRGLFFNSIRHYPLKEIASAEVDVSADHEGESYRLNIVLASGQELPLSHTYTGWRGDKDKAVQAINQFLKS